MAKTWSGIRRVARILSAHPKLGAPHLAFEMWVFRALHSLMVNPPSLLTIPHLHPKKAPFHRKPISTL